MDSPWLFFLLAAAVVAVVLALMLPGVWRGAPRPPSGRGAQRGAWRTTGVLVVGLPAVAIGFYALRGDLGALDNASSALSEQFAQQGLPVEGEVSEQFYAELERHLRKQPRDYRALVFKARLDMRAERFDKAVAAYEKAVSGRSKVANDPGVWVEYAEARGMTQGRSLVGLPLQLVQKALELDARHVQALDLAGSAAWEMRDFAKSAMYWKRLLAQIPPGDPRQAELSEAIARAERHSRLSLPPTP